MPAKRRRRGFAPGLLSAVTHAPAIALGPEEERRPLALRTEGLPPTAVIARARCPLAEALYQRLVVIEAG